MTYYVGLGVRECVTWICLAEISAQTWDFWILPGTQDVSEGLTLSRFWEWMVRWSHRRRAPGRTRTATQWNEILPW